MIGGIGPHSNNNRNAAQRAHEYQVYKNITESVNTSSGKANSSNNLSADASGAGCAIILVLAIILGVVSAVSPVAEGFLFWGTLIFLFIKFVFS